MIGADGSYTYTLTNPLHPDIEDLADGETTNDIFTYGLKDDDGDWSTTTLNITITGTNEAPTAIVNYNYVK